MLDETLRMRNSIKRNVRTSLADQFDRLGVELFRAPSFNSLFLTNGAMLTHSHGTIPTLRKFDLVLWKEASLQGTPSLPYKSNCRNNSSTLSP